jgi:hypothetical protein
MTIMSSPDMPRSLDEQQREFAQRRGLAPHPRFQERAV